MAFSQIATSVTIINSGLIGYFGLSLTEYSSTSLSAIAAGSAIEIAGAYFKADADVAINASSWSAITSANTAYLHLTPSGTAGSQILSAAWDTSAGVWDSSIQGFYASAASSTRVVASAYKVSSTQAICKKYIREQNKQLKWATFSGITGSTVSTVISITVPDVPIQKVHALEMFVEYVEAPNYYQFKPDCNTFSPSSGTSIYSYLLTGRLTETSISISVRLATSATALVNKPIIGAIGYGD